eukprot:TRINITY_DN20017_c0_g1_i1.p1 TRINITY_DN20017_c0_g1~~TRINITY_DN20017_c0_g1_i1.p1  ORF type:complete len:822 (+),score=131.70 TRINITY_DN20017_c0_g1_i1:339-2468(+)
MRNCIGRVVELLKAAEGGCIGICWSDEHMLTVRCDEPYPAVLNLLKHVKGDPHYRGYDLVFTKREPDDLSRIAHLRRALESELEKLRWETGKFDPSTFHTYPLESRLVDYKPLVTKIIEGLEESPPQPPTEETLETARKAWEWAIRYALFIQCSPEPSLDGTQWLERATQVLCNLVDSEGAPNSLEPAAGVNPLFPYNKSDFPTEPAGGNYWRYNEAFGLPDPAKRKKADVNDPCILINTDSSCWLNSALVPLRESKVFRNLLFGVRPYKPEWQGAVREGNTPLNTTAMKFVHRLQSLFAFMSPVGEHKYAFNPHVREAVDEFRHIQTGGYASGNDVSEFLGVLPDILLAASKCCTDKTDQANISRVIDDTFYCRTVSVSLNPTADDQPSTSSRSEYPLMVDSGGELGVKLMRALETGMHSLQYFEKTPKLLSVVVRRKLWDKVKNRPYISKEPIEIPRELCLDALFGDDDCIELRKKLMKAEQLISELQGYDPSVQFRVAPNPMPECLTGEVGEDVVKELRVTLDALGEQVRCIQETRDKLLKKETEEAEGVLATLRAKMTERGKANYSLIAIIVYQDSFRGHYYAYVDVRGKWYKCDDKAEMGELPTFTPCEMETALEDASTTASILFYQESTAAAYDEDPLPAHLQSRVNQDNAKLAHYISQMPDPEDVSASRISSSTYHYDTTSYEYGDDPEYATDGSSDYAGYH